MIKDFTYEELKTAFYKIKQEGVPPQRYEHDYRGTLENEYFTVPVKYWISVVTGQYPEEFISTEAVAKLSKFWQVSIYRKQKKYIKRPNVIQG